MRKKVLIAGVLSAVTVAAGAYGIFNMLDVSSSKANFQKTANVESTVQAGKLEFTVSKLTGLNVSRARESIYEPTGVSVGTLVGNTTAGMSAANDGIVSYMQDFENISPGWADVYGFEVENTGTLDEYLNLYIGTSHEAGVTAPTWDEQDPRSRIKYTIYRGTSLTANLAVVKTGFLNESGYAKLQIPGKVDNTNVTLNAATTGGSAVPAGKCYYVIKLEFTENAGIYSPLNIGTNINVSGDNIYQNSKIKVNLAIGTTGPNSANEFEFPTRTN